MIKNACFQTRTSVIFFTLFVEAALPQSVFPLETIAHDWGLYLPSSCFIKKFHEEGVMSSFAREKFSLQAAPEVLAAFVA